MSRVLLLLSIAALQSCGDPPSLTDSPPVEQSQEVVDVDDPYASEYRRTVYPERLYLPTHMDKFGDVYFIVDCYNNRVLYSRDKSLPVTEWNVLDDDLSWPHSIASDGEFYLVDNTQAHELRVYRRDGRGGFMLHQVITDVGRRPHRTVYDPQSQAFYVLAAESQHIARLERNGEGLELAYLKPLPFLQGSYARSFSLIGGEMYFVSGPGTINIVDYRSGSYEVRESYAVPDRLASSNDIHFVDGVFLLSATLNQLVRCESLQALAQDSCESVYDMLGFRGNPYFFSVFDGATHVTEIAAGDTIHALYDIDGDIQAKNLFTP